MNTIGYMAIALWFFVQANAFCDKILLDEGTRGAYLSMQPELAMTGGFQAEFVWKTRQDCHDIRFKKDGAERRMIAMKLSPSMRWEEHLALDMKASIKLADGQKARPCVMLAEREGGSWFRIGMPFMQDGVEDVRLDLANPRLASFSRDENGKLDWQHVGEVYIGAVVEGVGEGELKIYHAKLTNEKFVPSKPIVINVPIAKAVSRGADPAAKVSVEDTEVEGERVLKETFKFPLGRHMYFTPSFRLPDLDYASYSGFRLTYKATIPQPIGGLLVTVSEGGGQFVAPAPKASSEWLSIDLKFKDFKMASWAKKKGDNPQFDVASITSMVIGCHGTANGDSGEGEIWIRKIELIP